MNKNTVDLSLETTRGIDDNTGRTIITFTPVFTPDVTATGELRFAPWQAYEDDEEDMMRARGCAMANALHCMSLFAKSL